MSKFETFDQAYDHCMKRATTDATFRAALLADPRSTLATELGIEIPADFQFKVLEQPEHGCLMVLPPLESGELSDADLEHVAGGSKSGVKHWLEDQVKVPSHGGRAVFGHGLGRRH
jgi:hypothetical protein